MPFIESFQEFRERMGCPFVPTNRGYVFENGGTSDGAYHSDPPTDRKALLSLQIDFLSAVLKREESLFRQCQSYITTQSEYHARGAGPLPHDEAFTDLDRFKTNVLRLREQIDAKRTELAALRESSPFDAHQQSRSQQRAAAAATIKRATSVEI